MKKVICTFILLAMLCSAACSPAVSNDNSQPESQASSETESSVSEESKAVVPEVIIPEESYDISDYHKGGELKGKVIYKAEGDTISADVFANNKDITDLYIEDGVTTINSGAFAGCSALETIRLPSTLTDLGKGDGNTFADCTSLKAIYIPEGVTSLPFEIFQGCTSLSVVSLPSSLTVIDGYAFSNCTSLVSLKLPENLATISKHVFFNSGLKVLELPDNLNVTWPVDVETIYVTKDSATYNSVIETGGYGKILFK